jgi:hypothetical protein
MRKLSQRARDTIQLTHSLARHCFIEWIDGRFSIPRFVSSPTADRERASHFFSKMSVPGSCIWSADWLLVQKLRLHVCKEQAKTANAGECVEQCVVCWAWGEKHLTVPTDTFHGREYSESLCGLV